MKEYEKHPNFSRFTVVDAIGNVLHTPPEPQGLIVVESQSEETEYPVLVIGEVSDDKLVNLFIETPGGAPLMYHGDTEGWQDDNASSHELILDRQDQLNVPME